MSNPVKLGIIGLGAIGDRILKSIQGEVSVKVSAVCDVNEELAQRTSREYGDVAWFTDYQIMLKQAELDLVYLAVPPKLHERIALDIIKANKHILCEKPLANSVEEGERMLAAAEQAGIVHAMHFPLNYQSALMKFASLIQAGYIGNLRRIRLVMHFPHWPRLWQQNNWVGGREQGGYVLEVGVHWIQALQKIFGPVSSVKSELQFPDNPALCENSIVAQMLLEDGTPVLIDGLSHIAGEENIEFAAYGTEGTIMLRNWRTLLAGKNGEGLQEVAVDDVTPNNMIAEVVKAVKGEDAEIYDFRTGLDAQIVLEALRNPLDSEWTNLQRNL